MINTWLIMYDSQHMANGRILYGYVVCNDVCPVGHLLHNYGKWPLIAELPINHGDFPWLC